MTVRVGLVGSGAISAFHIVAMRDFPEVIQLSAVCDVNEDAAKGLASSIGEHVEVYTDMNEMLANADINAVDVCTPHFLHAPQTIAAAQAGKHVLVEKPMACSAQEAKDMVAAAEGAGVTLMVAQVLRYQPGSFGVKRLLNDGELGDIRFARADDWFASLPQKGWVRDRNLAGGGVLHMGSTHHIDLFRFYFGNVGAVRAHTWANDKDLTNGSEDYAVATLEFETGVVAQISASWASSQTPHLFQYAVFGNAGTLQTVIQENTGFDALHQFHAPAVMNRGGKDEGFIPVPPVTDGLVEGDRPEYEPKPPFARPWVSEMLHFADCVTNGREPLTSGRDNLETMKTVYACYESARSKREVLVEEM